MALINYSKEDSSADYAVHLWEGATNGGTPDTFGAVLVQKTPYNITLQVSGTFGASASVALHGSLDGTNYTALADLSGTEIGLGASGIASARDAALYLKPVLTSGNGSTDIDVRLMVRFTK